VTDRRLADWRIFAQQKTEIPNRFAKIGFRSNRLDCFSGIKNVSFFLTAFY